MNRNLGFLSILLISGLLLSACGSVTVNVTPPPIGVTIVLGGDTPTPASSNGNAPSDAVMMLFYGILAVVGVILLIALFAFLRRTDQ